MRLVPWLLVLKFLGVLGYAGGATAAFVAPDAVVRRRAVHRLASPALLVVWLSGYALAGLLGIPASELWLVGGLALSFVSLLALVRSVARAERTPAAFAATAVPIALVVVLMALRPTWPR